LPNLLENSDSVIVDPHGRRRRSALDVDGDAGALGVVDGVIEHFCEAVVPDIENVCRECLEKVLDVLSPDDVLLGRIGKLVPVPPLDKRLELVDSLSALSGLYEAALTDEFVEVLVRALPTDPELVGGEASTRSRMNFRISSPRALILPGATFCP